MKDTFIVFVGLTSILAIGVWSFFRTNQQENKAESNTNITQSEESVPDTIQRVSISEMRSIVLSGNPNEETVLLDTRPTSLWSESHIIGSRSFSEDVQREFLLPKETAQKTPIWIIITPNATSANQAREALRERGVQDDRIKLFDGTHETWEAETGLVIRRANPESAVDVTKVRLASPEEAKAEIARGGPWFLLDIRSPESFAAGHLPGATNIPLPNVERDRALIPKTATIFVYGKNDRESFAGGVLLFDLGFFNTLTLSAGFDEWKNKNLPTEQ